MEEEVDTVRRIETLTDLAWFFMLRYDMSGNVKRLDVAVALLQHCIRELPFSHPATISAGNTCVKVLLDRSHDGFRVEDCEHALSLQRNIILVAPPSHRARCAVNLARALRHRAFYSPSEVTKYTEESITLLTHTIKNACLSPVLRYELTLELARSSRMQIHLSSSPAEIISRTIDLFTQCMKMGRSAPIIVRSGLLSSFGFALISQGGLLSRQRDGDLDRGISYLRQVTDILDFMQFCPTRWGAMSLLAHGLSYRARRSGSREDLDESIAICREIMKYEENIPSSVKNAVVLVFGICLDMRFQTANRVEDLDEAIRWHRKLLAGRYGSYTHALSLNNLACALLHHFKQSGDQANLDEVIFLTREAILILKAGSNSLRVATASENTLGNALLARSEICGSVTDIEEAISLHQEVVKCVEGYEAALAFQDLASAWRRRYQLSLEPADLTEAHSALKNALSHLHPTHPFRCSVQHNFGEAYMLLFFVSREQCHLTCAVNSFRLSTTCISASIWERFRAASTWAEKVDSLHESDLEAYEAATEFLPRLADLSLSIQFRQDALKFGTDGLARNAAACAVRRGHIKRAVELLEEGRGVFWAQLLKLRSPLDALREVAPDAQLKLANISWALEHGAKNFGPCGEDKIAIEKEETRLRSLNEEWLTTVDQIRKISGFKNFLRPLRFIFLQEAARFGPVIILNAAPLAVAIDALIMTQIEVQRVSLGKMNTKTAEGLVKKIHAAAALSGRWDNSQLSDETIHKIQNIIGVDSLDSHLPLDCERLRYGRLGGRPTVDPNSIFQDILGVLWNSIVEPILSSLNMLREHQQNLPHIYWCLTGPLAFLPIHAAGQYHDKGGHCVSDYVISSYTPTIGVLRTRENDSASVPFRMMIVVQPNELSQTDMELKNIQARIPASSLIPLGIPGSPASVDAILTDLPNVTVAHFACHGVQDPINPLESALLVDGERLKISQILQQPLPNASLAFLCACQTAKGATELPDEAMHLGATLLFAGFTSVVGTMWNIADEDGPQISDVFYQHLMIQPEKKQQSVSDDIIIDTSRSAEALHYAVKNLRDSGAPFARWVPYIHMGR